MRKKHFRGSYTNAVFPLCFLWLSFNEIQTKKALVNFEKAKDKFYCRSVLLYLHASHWGGM